MRKGESAEQLRARLEDIDPFEFEHFVADLWENLGWETTVSQASNDLGVDIVATKLEGVIQQKAAIQAKRYARGNTINRDKIQQYHSMKVQDAETDVAIVVTTSSFSDGARTWAKEHNVKLVDGEDLVDMIRERELYDLLDEYAPLPEPINEEETERERERPRGFIANFLRTLRGSAPDEEEQSAAAERTEAEPDSKPAPDPEPEPAPRSRSPSRSTTAHTDYYNFVVLSFWMQVAGFVLILAPSLLPIITETMAGAILFFGLIAAPIAVFADANELHLKATDYRPNRLLWPAFVLVLPIIGLLFYYQKRP